MTDLPIACRLFENETRRRRNRRLARGFARTQEGRSLDDGHALRFAADDAMVTDAPAAPRL